ncbi:MAG: hypothetical protein GXY50_04205 [Syntrophomonadaceae bacterium]|nr:hypothetical protein [Syntrophomonadaceae bacterium]
MDTNNNMDIVENAKVCDINGSLDAIKGMDEARRNTLSTLGISTPADLLKKGAKMFPRWEIANHLMEAEDSSSNPFQGQEDIYYNTVTSYVKQACLWQVMDIDPDTAYLLVQMGIRHVKDLEKADCETTYTIMQVLWQSQPQYKLISYAELEKLIINAVEITGLPPYYPDNIASIYFTIECEDPVPAHLFSESEGFYYPVNPEQGLSLDSDKSLIPVKGIGVRRNDLFAEIGIPTASSLLNNGRLISQRQEIAAKIVDAEINSYSRRVTKPRAKKLRETYLKIITSCVKQIDLWRVEGMDVDTAYFLVQMGVRFVEDLRMVDAEKAYPILIKQGLVQPEYRVIDKRTLQKLIDNAAAASNDYTVYQKSLDEKLEAILKKHVPGINKEKLNSIKDSFYIEDRMKGGSIECDDDPPVYLFRDGFNTRENLNNDDLYYGLSVLRDIELVLPLPRIIRGIVMLGEDKALELEPNLLYGAVVEVIGVASPVTDKTEDSENPYGYLDGDGKFVVVLPEQYNLKDSVTLKVSKDKYSQSFNFTATDILRHVKENETLRQLNELQLLIREKAPFLDEDTVNSLAADEEVADLMRKISLQDLSTNNIGTIIDHLLTNDRLEAVFGEKEDLGEALVINPYVFKNISSKPRKVLPSVKLMENDGESTYLPTDTAPSQIFSYSILNRLTEPTIGQTAGSKNKSRKSIDQGIDVMSFKNTVAANPDQWPQATSLAIGYILNMQQAWVPDGFALGSLLYSLVLAPGEEQRLIVREKTQSYSIRDQGEAKDYTAQEYTTEQDDNMRAAYEYALNQLAEGNSAMQYKTSTSSWGVGGSLSGSYGGIGGSLGIGYRKSKSTGSASSSASQANSHNEISNAAQSFQHGIKTASEKISQAQRMAISMATSAENQSVATKIIANHNHSHAMTIQYWEVMRRYSLETCISGVDLVLFIPLQLINFLNGQNYNFLKLSSASSAASNSSSEESVMNPGIFNKRYEILLKYADTLSVALPYSYRTGMNLIKQFAALPKWMMEKNQESASVYTLTFQGIFLPFDDINVDMVLKNGGGTFAGDVEYERNRFVSYIRQSSVLKESIKAIRNLSLATNKSHESLAPGNIVKTCTCTFMLPAGYSNEDILYFRIKHSSDSLNYVLYKDPDEKTAEGKTAGQLESSWIDKYWDLMKDRDDSAADQRKIDYYKSFLPEAYVTPNVWLSPLELRSLGALKISAVSLKKENINVSQTSTELSSTIYVTVRHNVPVLKYSELQQIESTLHHIASHTMKYSQAVWNALSSDERALMLEQYTIEMDFSQITGDTDGSGQSNQWDNRQPITIPLLNCINVKKMLGFYGNCMLFPFTYPQSLAEKIGKTAVELQDSLYRYHTNYFRVPTTVVSMPTDGMIGEAVLGETNVSEEIDLTRFWNWKDSPIERMTLDGSYLDGTDYLAGKTTKDISALNMEGVQATAPVTVPDLITALVNKQTPSFDNLTGLEQLAQILNTATNTTATGRDAALKSAAESMKNALEYSYKAGGGKSEDEKTSPEGGSNAGGNAGGGGSTSGGSADKGSKLGSNADSGSTSGGNADTGSKLGSNADSRSTPDGNADTGSKLGSNADSGSTPGGDTPGNGKKIGFIINCSDPKGNPINTVEDGKVFEKVFAYYGIDYTGRQFYNAMTTEVHEGIKKNVDGLSENDTVYVHIACHGSPLPKDGSDDYYDQAGLWLSLADDGSGEADLTPYDSQRYDDGDVFDPGLYDLFNYNNKAQKIMFIDACHAESMIGAVKELKDTRYHTSSPNTPTPSQDWKIFFGAWPEQYSWDAGGAPNYATKSGGKATDVWAAGIRQINNERAYSPSGGKNVTLSFGDLFDFLLNYQPKELAIKPYTRYLKDKQNNYVVDQQGNRVTKTYYELFNPTESVLARMSSQDMFKDITIPYDGKYIKAEEYFKDILYNPSGEAIMEKLREKFDDTLPAEYNHQLHQKLVLYYQILSTYPESPGNERDDILFERPANQLKDLEF